MIRPPTIGAAPAAYSPAFFSSFLNELRAFCDRVNRPYAHNASTLNIDIGTLPTEADIATLRSGDVYRDTTASNVLKIVP